VRTALCTALGIEFPIIGFSHCRDVVAAVSRSGGLGVLGAGGLNADELDRELTRLDEESLGRPYGVDLVIPGKTLGDDPEQLAAKIPEAHRLFVDGLYDRFAIPRPPAPTSPDEAWRIRGRRRASEQVGVALSHRPAMVASALGPPPDFVVEAAHEGGVLVAGLVGAPEHVSHQLAAGTDIIVAQGTEAGGHTGEITSLVLVPQVVDAADGHAVAAAGGIGDGRQLAAMLALGAQAGWVGSLWLPTAESDLHPVIKEKLLRANSRDTVRSRCRTGKPVRQLRTAWVEAWEEPGAPEPLPTPLQQMLVRPQLEMISRYGVAQPAGSAVGQVVGTLRRQTSTRTAFDELVEDALGAMEQLSDLATA
jgi:NAD(P)H-dependent flavin oxidoreductase YrpB (nitropropane dioxygenase family)